MKRADRTDELFKNSKVDLLSLVPEETTRGYEIIVSEFERASEKFLRIWSKGGRKGSQIELKRLIEPKSFGKLLGQYQAEGQKSEKVARAEFTNKLIEEHYDFVQSLESMGVNVDLIHFYCNYNDELIETERVKSKCDQFEDRLDKKIRKTISHKSKGSLYFRTRVQNMIFTEILLNSMHIIRGNIASEIGPENEILAQCFLAKLLTGDGTLDTTISSARTYNSPSINVRIVDQNLSALEDYKDVLSNFGFQPFINEEHIYARSSCSLENLLFLYEIEAFKNTKNWKKLALTVMLILNGRRYSTYKRFIDFLELEKITSRIVSDRYDVGRRAAQGWLENKVEEGLLEVCRESPYPKIYGLTEEGREFAAKLAYIIEFSDNIKENKEVKEYSKALEALKDDIRR